MILLCFYVLATNGRHNSATEKMLRVNNGKAGCSSFKNGEYYRIKNYS
jgi:hypothetical protein